MAAPEDPRALPAPPADGARDDTATMPLAPRVAEWVRPYAPGPLTEAETRQFFEDGWFIRRDLIAADLIEGARRAVAGLVEDIAQRLFKAGKIASLHSELPFETRMIAIEREFPHASVLLHKYGELPRGIADLWGSKVLLDCAEQLLGPELAGHPVWNLRVKTPQQEQATVPWHQDCAYLDPSGRDPLQVTAWIPLVDATERNGCMQVVHRGHRSGREAKHACCTGGTWYVEMVEGEMERLGCDLARDVVTCEVPRGGVLFLNSFIPHRSLNNLSDGVRWSLDLRWQVPGLPCGFYGIKEPILMRTAAEPDLAINWAGWAEVNRTELQTDAVRRNLTTWKRIEAAVDEDEEGGASGGGASGGGGGGGGSRGGEGDSGVGEGAGGSAEAVEGKEERRESKFDTIIIGPWMDRWEIVNRNRHVDAHLRAKADGVTETVVSF